MIECVLCLALAALTTAPEPRRVVDIEDRIPALTLPVPRKEG